jgi:hypothetical protein
MKTGAAPGTGARFETIRTQTSMAGSARRKSARSGESIEEFGVLTSSVASPVPLLAASKKRRPPGLIARKLRNCKIWLVKALAI